MLAAIYPAMQAQTQPCGRDENYVKSVKTTSATPYTNTIDKYLVPAMQDAGFTPAEKTTDFELGDLFRNNSGIAIHLTCLLLRNTILRIA
jgi:hypothetical protein